MNVSALSPMLCRSADELPVGSGWAFEPKLDGFRGIVHRDGHRVEIRGRNGGRLTDRFPEIAAAVRRLQVGHLLLDGEIVAGTQTGLDFDALLARYDGNAQEQTGISIGYVVFDLLALDGRDLRSSPLQDRRMALERALGDAAGVVRASLQTEDVEVAREWLGSFVGRGLEGVVCKRLGEPYKPGQRGWVKVKIRRTLDAVIGGLAGSTSAQQGLLLGLFDGDGGLRYIGRASVPPMMREQVLGTLQPLSESPFARERSPGRGRWERVGPWVPVVPDRVVEVAYTALSSGMLRHQARVVRTRVDKSAEECLSAELPPR